LGSKLEPVAIDSNPKAVPIDPNPTEVLDMGPVLLYTVKDALAPEGSRTQVEGVNLATKGPWVSGTAGGLIKLRAIEVFKVL
jgi:hypothetical protein